MDEAKAYMNQRGGCFTVKEGEQWNPEWIKQEEECRATWS